MRVIQEQIPLSRLKAECMTSFDTMIKTVVDCRREIMVVDAELHADEETVLLEQGSSQDDLWGINIYPEKTGEEFIEFTSLINIRPNQQNPSMEILDEELKKKISEIVSKLIDLAS
jgi:hypothetical protein